MKFGFVLNPFAGMGGTVGLKGTDGPALIEAMSRGAMPLANERARLAMLSAGDMHSITFLTAKGQMGGDLLKELGLAHTIVNDPPMPSNGMDTTNTVKLFCEHGCDLIIFCGGDGTAKDVMEGIEGEIPCIGIPSGVKMHSGVFANSPYDAGSLIKEYILGPRALRKSEIMDIDEELFREGKLRARLIGYLTVLDDSMLVQPPKGTMDLSNEDAEKEEVGAYLASLIEKGTTYVLGPGTTVEAFAKELGINKTLLGVDIIRGGILVVQDATEKEIIDEIEDKKDVKIVVTPIGGQGFIFGRGNQQLSSKVIRSVGLNNIMIIATPGKLRNLRLLKVDTGDPTLDDELKGYRRVIVGFGRERTMRLE